jgi:hypothetical protein
MDRRGVGVVRISEDESNSSLSGNRRLSPPAKINAHLGDLCCKRLVLSRYVKGAAIKIPAELRTRRIILHAQKM